MSTPRPSTVRVVAPAPNRLADRLITVDDAWARVAPPPRDYLLSDTRTGRGAMPARGAALLVAAGGAGKSWASIGLAVAIATGSAWAGVMRPMRPGRALIVTAEDPADELRRRIYAQCRAAGIDALPAGAIEIVDVHDVHAPLLTSAGEPSDDARALIELCAGRGPYDLVVVDPIARVAGVSIDADNAMACALVTAMESIATAARGLVLGVHHTSQGARRAGIVDATAARGATGLTDSVRMVMVLATETVDHDDPAIADRLGEIVTIHAAKANHVRRWDPIRLRRATDGVLVPLDAIDGAIVDDARAASSPAVRRRVDRAADRAAQAAEAEAAVVDVVRGSPGVVTRDLRSRVMERLHVGAATATEAIDRARASGRIVATEGRQRATHYHLAGGTP